MIKIATAECFTHGQVGMEIHSFIQSYKGELESKYLKDIYKDGNIEDIHKNLILSSTLFLPSIDSLKKILNINPTEPYQVINGVKIYKEEEDKIISTLMANAVKKLLNVDVGIGTTAGIGKGGITISSSKLDIVTTTDVYADLRTLTDISLNESELIFKRQESGITKTLKIFSCLLNNDLDKINQFENVKIVKK
ncbi:MAG: FeGP cofactor biosynthesis protein HcgF family protein [Methanobrevibacter sp.]|jgi:uncharacterized protein (UPF0254 family)|nr:FeGP cofactor biosynthesis protein HcgF family protein [Candidatus Methanovirga basalitermitum]